MCKIFVSLLVLVAIISLSKSKGIIPTDVVADVFEEGAKPVAQTGGTINGLVVGGESGSEFGAENAPKVVDKLADNIRESENGTTTEQGSATIGSLAGTGLGVVGGASTVALKQNETEAVANANKGADDGKELGNTIGETVPKI